MNPRDNIIPEIAIVVTSLVIIPPHLKMPIIDFLARDHKNPVIFMSLDNGTKVEWLEMNFNRGSSSGHP